MAPSLVLTLFQRSKSKYTFFRRNRVQRKKRIGTIIILAVRNSHMIGLRKNDISEPSEPCTCNIIDFLYNTLVINDRTVYIA